MILQHRAKRRPFLMSVSPETFTAWTGMGMGRLVRGWGKKMEKEHKIRYLLKKYTNIIEKLQELGVIKTSKVISDYGEYLVSKRLGLKLISSPNNKGYDAFDPKTKKKYEIKSRKSTRHNKATVIPKPNRNQINTADFLVGVRFDNSWNVDALIKIPMTKVKKIINKYNRININKDLMKEFSV